MKLNTLFVAAICAGTLLNSCVDKTAKERQLKYTHTSLVDGDAFASVKIIGEAASDGVKYAEWAEKSADDKGIAAAGKVKAFYTQLIPHLDSLATAVQIDYPVKGIPTGHDHADTTVVADSTEEHNHAAHNHFDYVSHVQHEVATIKEQLKRMSRNTNVDVQAFGKKQLALAEELYTQIGGKADAQAHH